MSLRHAILGILTIGPASGYDLSKFMDIGIAFVWNANHSQIYLELKKLKEAELVDSTILYQISKPNKEIYTITEKGREELKHWLMLSSDKTVLKDPFLLRAFFMNQLDPKQALSKFEEHIEVQERQTREITEIQNFINSLMDLNLEQLNRDFYFQKLVIELSAQISKIYLKWLEDTVKDINERFLSNQQNNK